MYGYSIISADGATMSGTIHASLREAGRRLARLIAAGVRAVITDLSAESWLAGAVTASPVVARIDVDDGGHVRVRGRNALSSHWYTHAI